MVLVGISLGKKKFVLEGRLYIINIYERVFVSSEDFVYIWLKGFLVVIVVVCGNEFGYG